MYTVEQFSAGTAMLIQRYELVASVVRVTIVGYCRMDCYEFTTLNTYFGCLLKVLVVQKSTCCGKKPWFNSTNNSHSGGVAWLAAAERMR